MIINTLNTKQKINFGYKVCFDKTAFNQFSKEMKDPLNSYSLRIIKDVNEGLDSFNAKIASREGVPNLYDAKIIIDDVKTTIGNGRGEEKLLYGFDIKGLPVAIEEFITEEMQFRPKQYYVAVPNKEYNKKDANPFENALNKMFEKIKSMIDKHTQIEKGLQKIEENHVE
ncbi:MAG: hypothetical protein WCF95_05165 [bacterium]